MCKDGNENTVEHFFTLIVFGRCLLTLKVFKVFLGGQVARPLTIIFRAISSYMLMFLLLFLL